MKRTRSNRSQKAVDEATTTSRSTPVGETDRTHQMEHGKREKKKPEERNSVKVELINICDSDEEQKPTVEGKMQKKTKFYYFKKSNLVILLV